MNKKSFLSVLTIVAAGFSTNALAASYSIDSSHTYPSFEADHLGGISKWRGKINQSEGKVTFDPAAKKGSVDLTMSMASIDFGHEKMNEHAKAEDIFNVKKYPVATFKSKDFVFEADKPVEIRGNLTLKGITKPVVLKVHEFKCMMHPIVKKEVCGADASAVINRADFAVDYALNMGFKPEVKILISVEAIKD